MPILRKKPNRSAYLFPQSFGCPVTKNRSSWCFDICTPVEGKGPCGRMAPQLIVGRTRRAIMNFEMKKRAAASSN